MFFFFFLIYGLLTLLLLDTIWAATWQNQQCVYSPSEDSNQPGHPPSLISLRCPHEETLGPSYPLSAQRRLWSDWVDSQADLSLRWAHTHFVGFVVSWLIYMYKETRYTTKSNVNFCGFSRRFLKLLIFKNVILTVRTVNWKMKTSLLMMGLMANIKSKQNVKCDVNVKIKQIFEPNIFVSSVFDPFFTTFRRRWNFAFDVFSVW